MGHWRGAFGTLLVATLVACQSPDRAPRTGERFHTDEPSLGLRLQPIGGFSSGRGPELVGEPLVLVVWATWCDACAKELSYLNELFVRHRGQGLRVVGIAIDDDPDTVARFLSTRGIRFENWLDPAEYSIGRFDLVGVPSTYVLREDGLVLLFRAGLIRRGDPALESAIQEALREQPV